MRRVASAAPAIAAMPAAPSATPSGAFVVPSPVWLSFEVFAAVSLPFFSSPSALGRLTGSCAGAVGSSREGLLLFATSFVGSCRPDPGVVSGLSGGVVLPEALFPRAASFRIQREASCSRGSTAMQAELEPRCLRPASGFRRDRPVRRRRSRAGRVRSERSAGSLRALPAGSPRAAGRSRAVSSRSKAHLRCLPREGCSRPAEPQGNPPQGALPRQEARWVSREAGSGTAPFPVCTCSSSLRGTAAGRGRTRPRALSRNRTAW